MTTITAETDMTTVAAASLATLTISNLKSLTPVQLSALSSMQLSALPATLIAALPLKYISANALTGISITEIHGLVIKNISPAQIAALSPAQIAALNSQQIAALSSEEFNALTVAQTAALTVTQAAALKNNVLAELTSDHVAALSTAFLSALTANKFSSFTAAQLPAFSGAQLTAITANQISTFNSEQINALSSAQIANLSPDLLAALSTDALAGLTTKNIAGLSTAQMHALTTAQLAAFNPDQLDTLSDTQFLALNSEGIAALSADTLKGVGIDLSGDATSKLTPKQIAVLTPEQLAGFTNNQLIALTTTQAAALQATQIEALSSTQATLLSTAAIAALNPYAIKALALNAFSSADITAFTTKQAANLTAENLGQLTSNNSNGLTAAQLAVIKLNSLKGLTTAAVSHLTTSGVAVLTSNQFARLSTADLNQLESFTPAQVAQLSTASKLWLESQNFIRVEGGFTSGQGVETTNTLTQTNSNTETITATGIDNTFSYDTSAHLLLDTINGGMGNDTLEIAGSIVLTSLANQTNIEKLTATANNTNENTHSIALASNAALSNFTAIDLSADSNVNSTAAINLSGVTLPMNLKGVAAGTNTITGGAGSDVISGGAGSDSIVGSLGSDNISSNAGDDTISFNGAVTLTTVVTIDGGAGNDTLIFIDSSNAAITNELDHVTNIETIVLEGTSVVHIVTVDALVAPGKVLTVNGSALPYEMNWDGSAETDGTFNIIGSSNPDSFVGGFGGTVNGGGGDDVFPYLLDTDLFYPANHAAAHTLIDHIDGSIGTNKILIGVNGTTFTIANNDVWTNAANIQTIEATANTSDVSISLDATAQNAGIRKIDLSAVTGSGVIDISEFTAGASLSGGTGADTIKGGTGADSISGGAASNAASNNVYLYAASDSTLTATDALTGIFNGYSADLVKLNGIVGTMSVLPSQNISVLSETDLNVLTTDFKGSGNTSIASLTRTSDSKKFWAIDLNGDGNFVAANDLLIDVTNSTLTNVNVETFGVRLPTLSTISQATGTEDTEKAFSFGTVAGFTDLLGLADEADIADIYSRNGVNAFEVTSVNSGTLKIGTNSTSSSSATAWVAGSNDIIDATHFAFWIPDANANGVLNAFSVVAKDDDGYESLTPIAVNVNATVVNDAPIATDLNVAESYTRNTPLNLVDIVVSDVDSTTVTATLTLSNIAAGTLSSGAMTSSNGVWTANGTIENVNALLAGLTFTPATNFSSGFTITSNISDGTLSVSGSKEFANMVFTLNEDGVYNTFSAGSFGSNAATTSVKITSLPALGSLKRGSSEIVLTGTGKNNVVPVADISTLTYTPLANANGLPYSNFSFETDGATLSSLGQYASSIIGYSSQWSTGAWSAAQALGAPNTFSYGDISTAWETATINNSAPEYITVGFTTPVYAIGAVVREIYGNGFVTQIETLGTDDIYRTVWTGTDNSARGSVVDFLTTWAQTDYLVKGLRVHTNNNIGPSIWEAVDSIKLLNATNNSAAFDVTPVIDISINAGITPVEGFTTGTFTVTLDTAAPAGDLVVNYNLTGSSATLSSDYTVTAGANITAVSGSSFTIAEGQTTATLNINALTDSPLSDIDEIVTLSLTTGTGYQLLAGGTTAATLTITNNDAPTLTTFASTVASGNEDTAIPVTFANLQAQGNDADADDSVVAFVVKAVTSGSLLINGSVWNATTNNTIDATHSASWTPAANVNGNALNAFSVIAKDSRNAESSTAVQVPIAVAAVNDAPTLTTFASVVATGTEDTEQQISLTQLQTAGNEADIEDSVVGAFVVKAVSTGTLKIGLNSTTATAWNATTNNTIDATHFAYWTPAGNANGTLNAFTAVAKDSGGLESITQIQATVQITPVLDVSISAGIMPVEGGTVGSFNIMLDSAPVSDLIVNYNLTGLATLSSDYTVTAGANITNVTGSSFTIPAGQTTGTLSISALADGVTDPNENIALNLVAGTGYQLAASVTSYAAPSAIFIGTNIGPVSITSADFNNDGKLDFATANWWSNTASVKLGDGNGGFSGTTTLTTGGHPRSIITSDFNKDGKQDLAVANYYGTSFQVYLGNGDGSFISKPPITTGSNPYSLTTADFNNDGNLDMAIADNYSTSCFYISLGDGAGNFATPTADPIGVNQNAIISADFNGDGKPDIATANVGNTVKIFLNNGSGGFSSAASTVTVGNTPYSIAIADFNSDGKLDFTTADMWGSDISVRFGNGDGTFSGTTAIAIPFTTGSSATPNTVITTDYNNDGNVDIVVVSGNADLSVLYGDGHGNFSALTSIAAVRAQSAVRGDFNNDGKTDFIMASNDDQAGNSVYVLLNNSPATTSTLTITNDDAPTATNLSAAESYTEDTPLNLTDIVVSDDINGASITATLTLLNTVAGSLTTATSGSATSTYAPVNGVWTVTGAKADVNTLLAELTFIPAANFNSNVSVTTSISDSVNTAITGSKNFTGTAVNDAPLVSTIASATYNSATGHSYLLTTSTSWQDAENQAVALGGHLVTINNATEDTWLTSTFGSSSMWIGLNDLATENTFAWANGETTTATYRNWALNEPSNGIGEHFAMNNWSGGWNDGDAATPFQGIIEISGKLNTVTATEDTSYTFQLSDFGSDPENGLTNVTITSLPALGSLRLNGVAVTTNQVIPIASISTLTYTPVANANGVNYASLGYTLTDSGNLTASGTLSLNVTAVNDAPAFTFSNPDNALNFDGVNDYVSVGNTADVQLSTGTVEAWIKTSSSAGVQGIVVKSSAYGLFLNNGVLQSFSWGGVSWVSTSINLADNTWHHLALSFQSGVTDASKLYLDGNLVQTRTYTISNQLENLNIGAGFISSGNGQQLFAGSIDDVRIWNTARTAAEIAANKDHELTGGETGLVAYYNFNQTTGTTLPDLAGTANNGTLTNFTTPNWVTGALPENTNVSVAENSPTSTVIYDANATDVDSTLTYSVGGTDANYFNIDTSTGVVTLKNPANYEAKNSYTFTVSATDNVATPISKAVSVSVTDVVEAPVLNGSFEAGGEATTNTEYVYSGTPGTVNNWNYAATSPFNSGITTNQNIVWTSLPAADGSRMAFIQGLSSISQTVNFSNLGTYQINFKAIGRNLSSVAGSNGIDVKMDGTTIGTISANSISTSAWGDFSASYIASTAGNHTLTFAGVATTDLTTMIDKIWITDNGTFYNPANGHYYALTTSATWHDAETQAVAMGGHLVTVNNAAENTWLTTTFGSTERLWIGYNDATTEGTFTWANGETTTATYTNWGTSQPDNSGTSGSDYAVINYNSAGRWDDLSAAEIRRGIIEIVGTA